MRIFFLREALRALKRNAAPSLAAFATVLITTLVLGVFIPVVRAATAKTNEVRNKIELEVFIEDSASKAQIAELGNMIRDINHVDSIQFISKAQALSILKHRLGEKNDPITEGLLKSNPLPASYRIHLDDPGNVGVVKSSLAPRGTDGRPRYISPAINDVKDREDDTKKILSATSTIKLLLAVLAGLLVLASILLVANTIRLSIFARRREVEVMRLVGATNWFIRWPFVIEGLVVGFFGAAAAVALLWIAKVTIVDPWSDRFALIAAPRTISFTLLVLVLMAAGMAVSALGSGLTLRRFLRV
jgi:cell division transport system permease protein